MLDAIGFIAATARVILGTVFLASGLGKLSALQAATAAFKRLPLLRAVLRTPSAARFAVIAVSLAEILLGTLLIIGFLPWLASSTAIIVICGFTVILVSALARRENVSCGCFGGGSTKPVKWLDVGRNSALVGVGALGMLRIGSPYALWSQGAAVTARLLSMAVGTEVTLATFFVAMALHQSRQLESLSLRPVAQDTPLSQVWAGMREVRRKVEQ